MHSPSGAVGSDVSDPISSSNTSTPGVKGDSPPAIPPDSDIDDDPAAVNTAGGSGVESNEKNWMEPCGRKTRTPYNKFQLLELEKEFLYNTYVTKERRYHLAVILGLSIRQIKIWFQNRRMKAKLQRKKAEEGKRMYSTEMDFLAREMADKKKYGRNKEHNKEEKERSMSKDDSFSEDMDMVSYDSYLTDTIERELASDQVQKQDWIAHNGNNVGKGDSLVQQAQEAGIGSTQDPPSSRSTTSAATGHSSLDDEDDNLTWSQRVEDGHDTGDKMDTIEANDESVVVRVKTEPGTESNVSDHCEAKRPPLMDINDNMFRVSLPKVVLRDILTR